jgi:hypothetical protein
LTGAVDAVPEAHRCPIMLIDDDDEVPVGGPGAEKVLDDDRKH